jgi:hypothetical protein
MYSQLYLKSWAESSVAEPQIFIFALAPALTQSSATFIRPYELFFSSQIVVLDTLKITFFDKSISYID